MMRSSNKTNLIESLVDQILEKKKKDPNTDTSDLENQIDELVFELYRLTEEKRLIINNHESA